MSKARVYQQSKSAMQSGLARTKDWLLEFELETPRRPESLMGWTSSNDTLNQVKLRFSSCDDAVAYAEKHGLEYDIKPTKQRAIPPKNYAQNFRYRGGDQDEA